MFSNLKKEGASFLMFTICFSVAGMNTTIYYNFYTDPLGGNSGEEKSTDLQRFACENCPSVFRNKYYLHRHVKFECNKDPKYKCPYCNLLSKKSSNVFRHVRRMHPDYDVYIIDMRKDSKVIRIPTYKNQSHY